MARLFDRSNSENLRADSTPVTDWPFTMACFFRSDSLTVNQSLLWIGNDGSDFEYFDLTASGADSGDKVKISVRDSSSSPNVAETSIAYTADTWHHACAVIDNVASDHFKVFLDGENKGVSVGTRTPDGVDRVSIGANDRVTAINYMSGAIAEIAIWNVALTEAEVAILATGIRPWKVRPQNLVMYPPLIRDDDEDIVGGLSFTAIGSPTIAPHPRVLYSRK